MLSHVCCMFSAIDVLGRTAYTGLVYSIVYYVYVYIYVYCIYIHTHTYTYESEITLDRNESCRVNIRDWN